MSACPACGLGFRQGKAVFLLAPGGELRPCTVCRSCGERAALVVSPDTHHATRTVLAPFAAHLQRLAKGYELAGEAPGGQAAIAMGRAEGLRQAADILLSGRAVDAEPERAAASAPAQATEPARAPGAKAPRVVRDHNPEDVAAIGHCESSILTVLASRQPTGCSRVELAVRSGYSVESGGFHSALRGLQRAELIAGGGGVLVLTGQGARYLAEHRTASPPPAYTRLLEHWVDKVGTCAGTVLQVVVAAHPSELSREEVASRSGYSATSGGFHEALRELRKKALVTGMRASDALMGAIAPPERAAGRPRAQELLS